GAYEIGELLEFSRVLFRSRETVTGAADEPIPNLSGKRLVSQIVDYPPGASSVPHRHARSAFIYAYVLSGAIRSQVDDEPVRVYRDRKSVVEGRGEGVGGER